MKFCFVGHGRSGKDTACDYLSQITHLRNGGSTSKVFARHMAVLLGMPPERAYAERHDNRELWYQEANALRRERGMHHLLEEALRDADLSNGLRDKAEVIAAKQAGVYIVWVHNPRVAPDPTLHFGPDVADDAVYNTATLAAFHCQLMSFASRMGVQLR